MRKLSLILFVIFVFIFFWFSRFALLPALDSLFTSLIQKPEKIETPTTQELCLEKGGEWRKPGPWPKETCMMPYKDKGKTCISGFQCSSGQCVSSLNLRRPSIVGVGTCASYQILFGCIQLLHFGFTDTGVCLD